jgi:ArsR family transcriptional regulator, arsenate/arsenite/antimonite-responsive transcriptional repressor
METDSSSPPSVESIAEIFSALGQVSRLQIVRLLLATYPKGLPVGEIQKELSIAAPTLSHHLEKLRQVGVLRTEKDRQWIWYSVHSETLKQLMEFLYAECCTRNHVVVLAESADDSDVDCCA